MNDARRSPRRCGSEAFDAAPALVSDDALDEAARQHSRDMADSGELGHTGSRGEDLSDRIAAAGVSARAWAENVAAGQPDAQAAITSWLASSGHCRNLMTPEFEAYGAAVAHAEDGTPFWTLILVAPAD
ncbi:CAP domain-containing protein [Methylonatrum kenyense]|uniref:CAP domain-containing protein n=1 Tax=Methylonatrum kenyense TaxID=455253 RepID=UPI0020C0A817|nr:CAP domain-containing protein [Methylonatrum kenyense]MCK8515043.1 CAP domain-containing protein [Methylonatrum kenyense]